MLDALLGADATQYLRCSTCGSARVVQQGFPCFGLAQRALTSRFDRITLNMELSIPQ
jgi:hypothetical protein